LIVAFDLEGTLVDGELFPALGEYAGNKPILDDITDKAMRGELDYRTSLEQRINVIRGMSIETVREVAESLSLSKGAEETISRVKRMGGIPIIVTGGFDVLAERVAYLLGIEYFCCNRFKTENGHITGLQEPLITGAGKAEKLLGLASWLGINPRNCIAIGDGANDIQMMKSTGLSIAYNGREKVRETAKVSVNGNDLRLILPHIEEFVTRVSHESELIIKQIG
jgi:phosphoserine phosphatase